MIEDDNPRVASGRKLGLLELSLCALLTGIVLLTFAQVLFRYVFQTSLAWTEELARFMFIWLAALGAAYAFKKRAHFLLRFLVDKLSVGKRMVVETLAVFLMACFLAVFIVYAVFYVHSVAGQQSPGTGLSKAAPASAAVVGGVLMLYYIFRNWIEDIRNRSSNPCAESRKSELQEESPGGDRGFGGRA